MAEKKTKKKVPVETTKTSEKFVGDKKGKSKQLFRIGFKCDKAGGMVHVENVGTSFKCPSCGSPMKYEHKQMRLTTTASIRHEVRKVVEVGKK
jgi:predicted RNA-binding Zn-ribbon protein involved in translation (DUF1610 family)